MVDSLFLEAPFGEGGLFSARGDIAESDLISPWRVTGKGKWKFGERILEPVSYTHLRAHETGAYL
eukprot:1053009-Pyramimonas_sp.AAC.1